MEMKRADIIVHGRVQGVQFRSSTIKRARELGLRGYAKNLPDGTVEIVAEGPEKELEQLIDFCKKGPALAKVDKVEAKIGKPSGEFRDFALNH